MLRYVNKAKFSFLKNKNYDHDVTNETQEINNHI